MGRHGHAIGHLQTDWSSGCDILKADCRTLEVRWIAAGAFQEKIAAVSYLSWPPR
jgi:hypothetical protein